MINLHTVKQLIGILPQDEAELNLHRNALEEAAAALWEKLDRWSRKRYGCGIDALLDPCTFRLLLLGEAQEAFFPIVYQQALAWRRAGFRETDSMVLMSQLRQQFVDLGQQLDAPRLARALCHNVDMAQTVLTAVFQLSHQLMRFRERAEFEIRRIEHMFAMIEQAAPATLVGAYRDHQRWKQLAYELALGEPVEKQLELDPEKCALGVARISMRRTGACICWGRRFCGLPGSRRRMRRWS